MPGILEITAIEYYANKDEDDIENGIVGALIVEPENPNEEVIEAIIKGETFIKPNQAYEYKFEGEEQAAWIIDTKKYPIKWSANPKDLKNIKLIWTSQYSGQFEIAYGDYKKTIVVESLF